MGCSESVAVADQQAYAIQGQTPGDSSDEDEELVFEMGMVRAQQDKKTGQVMFEGEQEKKRRTTDYFDAQDEGSHETWLADKPFKDQIKEPSNKPEFNKAQPDGDWDLEHVYGYRSSNARQNLFFNDKSDAVYITAGLGVVLDIEDNTQTFFGGDDVENQEEALQNDLENHNDDVLCLAISNDRELCLSGQAGPGGAAFLWDSETCEVKKRFQLAEGFKGVAACSISADNKQICLAENSSDGCIQVLSVEDGSMVFTTSIKKKILDVQFSFDGKISVAGEKYFGIIDVGTGITECELNNQGPKTTHCSTCWDEKGRAYSGGSNGLIYIWENNACTSTVQLHADGFVCALRYFGGKIASGGKAGCVNIWDPETINVSARIEFGILVRAVDITDELCIVGLRDGSIKYFPLDDLENIVTLMESHADGEVWGLDVFEDKNEIMTSGDDNNHMIIDTKEKALVDEALITEEMVQGNGPVTMSAWPTSQQSRAVAVNGLDGMMAVAANDGRVYFKQGDIDDPPKAIVKAGDAWISCMSFCPHKKFLAVGSMDNKIYLFTPDFKLFGKLEGHTSGICSLDWAEESKGLMTTSMNHELMFWTFPDLKQQSAEDAKDVKWVTNTSKFGWAQLGIYPKNVDLHHINCVDFSKDGTMIATGDDYGQVCIFRNPALPGAIPITLKGHSEQVAKVKFSPDSQTLYSVGGADQAIMQWKRTAE